MAAARVLIIGAGGLGSPVALALAESAAVARLTLVDLDRAELSNLHRQLLLREGDLGTPKAMAAAATLRARRPRVADGRLAVVPLVLRLAAENAAALVREHDLVVEGSDDLLTKFLVNDCACALARPAVIGGVVRFTGQVLTVRPGAACYRCLFEEPPPEGTAVSCQQAGVLGPACGVVAGLMVKEALHILEGDVAAAPRSGPLITVDLLRGRTRRVPIGRRHDCSACGKVLSDGQKLDSGRPRP